MTLGSEKTTNFSINPKHDQEDREARGELINSQLPLKERFKLENIANIVMFLKEGYKLTKLNEFSGHSYSTEVSNNGKKKIFVHQSPLPVSLYKSDKYGYDGKEKKSDEIDKENQGIVINSFNNLLEEMKKEK